MLLQLGAMIAGNPGKFRPGATIAIQTASTREAEPWVFTVEGEEQLQLPGGKVATLKLTRNPRKEFDHQGRALAGSRDGLRPGAPASDTAERRLGRPAVVLHRQGLSRAIA